jgi:seryl-tRNA synthetase
MSKLSREVGEASKALTNDLPARFVSTKHTDALIQSAKKIQRMQNRRNALRRELRKLEQDIRHEKKMLKAMAAAIGKGE